MRTLKLLSLLAVVLLALSAIGVAGASAAQFTASATGSLEGNALNTQEFTTNAGVVKCTKAHTTGPITSTASEAQHVTVEYSNCNAFGFSSVTVSPATFTFTANGEFHIQNTIKINVPLAFCSVTIKPQSSKVTVQFENSGASNIREFNFFTNIKYTATEESLCGPSGNNGKWLGASEYHRVGGGTLRFDP